MYEMHLALFLKAGCDIAVAPSSFLPNSGDPGATVAHGCPNSGDLTAVERSDAARSHLFSIGLISLRPIQIERHGPRDTTSHTRA